MLAALCSRNHAEIPAATASTATTLTAVASKPSPACQRYAKSSNCQDLIEYALVAALIAVATIAGMSSVATAVNTLFSSIASTL